MTAWRAEADPGEGGAEKEGVVIGEFVGVRSWANVIRGVVGVSYNVGVRYTVAGAICLHLRCAPTICRHASERYARDLPTYKADTYAQTLARMHKPQHVCSNPRHVCSNSRYVCSNPSISLSCLSTDTSAQSNPFNCIYLCPNKSLNCISLP